MVLHPEETDGPKVTHRLMNRQPILWGSILNTTSCPSIVQLTKLAKAMEANLIAQYYNGLRIEKSKSVHAVEAASLEDSDKSAEDAGPSTTKEAHAVSRGAPRKRTDWPKGRTISGYSYSRDDSVVSKVAPPGPCFICLSPKRFFRDCPHNARFFGKSAHSVNTFHSSTDSSWIPWIPAGIQEFRGIPGILEDSGRNQQESKWNRHKFSSYFALLFQKCFGRGELTKIV